MTAIRPALRVLLARAAAPPAAARGARPWCGIGPRDAAGRTIRATGQSARILARPAEARSRPRSADSGWTAPLRQRRDACGAGTSRLRAARPDRIHPLGIRLLSRPRDGA